MHLGDFQRCWTFVIFYVILWSESRIRSESWILNPESLIQNPESLILNPQSWILNPEFWTGEGFAPPSPAPAGVLKVRTPVSPLGFRNPFNGGTIFGPLGDLCIGWGSNPAKRRGTGNIDFSFLASRMLLLISGLDLTQKPAHIFAKFWSKIDIFRKLLGVFLEH